MKSSKELRDTYRGMFKVNISCSSKRFKINKDILEELLFEVFYFEKNGVTYRVKVPVWSGEFLRYIDLSEIDFSDVTWSLYSCDYNHGWCDFVDKDTFERIKSKCYSQIKSNNYKSYGLFGDEFSNFNPNYINQFSGTNANIDLLQSFEAKNFHDIMIYNCDFTGLDFSKCLADYRGCMYVEVIESSIANTGLKLDESVSLHGFLSDFSDLDLSSHFISAYYYVKNANDSKSRRALRLCKLCNTGIEIYFSKQENQADNDFKKTINKAFRSVYCSGLWDGCYLIEESNLKLLDDENFSVDPRRRVLVSTSVERNNAKRRILDNYDCSIRAKFRAEYDSLSDQLKNYRF